MERFGRLAVQADVEVTVKRVLGSFVIETKAATRSLSALLC
jgi:hypothetical protein